MVTATDWSSFHLTNLALMGETKFLELAEIAELLGIKMESARVYHNLAAIRRRRNESRPGDMPPPDRRFGNTPVWLESTIDEWIARRPGQGAGGGPRPPTP